jgi:trk system potassium uptake protein
LRLRHLIHTVSIVLIAFSGALALTAAVALWLGDGDGGAFAVTAVGTAILGTVGMRTTELGRSLSVREGYAVVSLTWIITGAIGAVPYLLTGVISDPVAALFESVSGFTTTGATVFSDIESLPRGVLLWRSLTQWLGGMGIILLGVAILPFLGVGGMRLVNAEVPGPIPERLTPRIAQTAKFLWLVYAGLTVVLGLLLLLGGMSVFDAVNHALTTMPTGGFSPRNDSIAAFDSAFLQYTIIVFMYLAGVSFVLHFRMVTGRLGAYARSSEWRFYTGVLILAVSVILILLISPGDSFDAGLERTFRAVLFQVVSLTTTTGYVSFDYGLWPLAVQLVLVGLMFMGGMAGSTAGGIKAMRIFILLEQGLSELKRSLHPRAVIVSRIGPKVLDDEVLLNILGFVLLFLGIFAAGVFGLAVMGHDLPTAIGASVATIANIGPGIAGVGAVENFGWMGPGSHALLVLLMIVGRLEIFTVLLLFHPGLWRR